MALFTEPAWVQERQAEIRQIIDQYPDSRSAVMPLLHLAQEVRGYVADEDIAAVAEILGLTHAYVESVCSFYSMYHRHPVGKYHILMCNNASCALMGGETVREHLKKKLGIDTGETTADGLISLEVTHECLAACDAGPVLQVNGEYVVRLTPEKVDALVADLQAGKGAEAHIEKRLLTGLFHDADPNDLPQAPADLPPLTPADPVRGETGAGAVAGPAGTGAEGEAADASAPAEGAAAPAGAESGAESGAEAGTQAAEPRRPRVIRIVDGKPVEVEAAAGEEAAAAEGAGETGAAGAEDAAGDGEKGGEGQ